MIASKHPIRSVNARLARRKISKETLNEQRMNFAIAQEIRRGW